jgi:predicted aspartyl protease
MEKLRRIVPSVRNSLELRHISLRFWRRRPQRPQQSTTTSTIARADTTGTSHKDIVSSLATSCVIEPASSSSNSRIPDNPPSGSARTTGDLQHQYGDLISSPLAAELPTQSRPHSICSEAYDRNENNSLVSAALLDQSPSLTIGDQALQGAAKQQAAAVDGGMTHGVKNSWLEMPLEPDHAPAGQQLVRIQPIPFVNPNREQDIRPVNPTATSEGSDDEPQQYIISMAIHKPDVVGPGHVTPRRGLLDTGSDVNLVSGNIVAELNMQRYYEPSKVLTLGDKLVTTTYIVIIKWHVDGKPEKPYTTEFLVIPEEIPCAFDFLIGSGWINHTKALIRNHKVFFLR